MVDLQRDLERYGQELDATGSPISLEELRLRHPTSVAVRGWTRPVPVWITMVAAAAVVLMVLGGMSFILGGSEGSVEPVAPVVTSSMNELQETSITSTTVRASTNPDGVFEWGNDLSEWVTEDEMTTLLKSLSQRFYGNTAAFDPGDKAVLSRPGGDLVWSVGYWSVGVHAGNGWHPTPARTVPGLPQGVTYEPISQSYVFSGPNSSQSICITLTTPGTTASIDEEPNYERIFFDVATMMLEEMGWTDKPGGDD